MRQLTLVCQQSSKVLPQSHHILQHSIAHQCWTCSVQVQRQVINCCCCCCKKCVLACASLAVNKEALACSFSRAPALPLNTHDALIRQEASPSQRLATCLIFLFCLVVVHKQQSNANLADATNYARMLPRRTQKMCAPCSAPKTKRAIIDQAFLHSGFIAPCFICTQRENQCIAFPAHK